MRSYKKCPRCGGQYKGYGATSRRDDKTAICHDCGSAEALFDFSIHNLKHGLTESEIKRLKGKESEWLRKSNDGLYYYCRHCKSTCTYNKKTNTYRCNECGELYQI